MFQSYRGCLRLLLTAAIGCGQSACVVTDHTLYQGLPAPEVIPILYSSDTSPYREFAHDPLEEPPEFREIASDYAGYRSLEVTLPPNAETGLRLEATLYRNESRRANRLVIVLPIWGSAGFPQRKVVDTLLNRSEGALDVVAIRGNEWLFHWDALAAAQTESEFLSLAASSTRRVAATVIGIRQLIDVLVPFGDQEIDVVGFSMGALIGSIALGVEDRLTGGVLMMGGADPSEIFATCSSRKVARVRRTAYRRFGWSEEKFRAFLDAALATGDASRFAGRYDPSRILIIDGALDRCMNSTSREALWELTGRPERYRMLSTHRWAFMALTPLTLNQAGRKIHEFVMRGARDSNRMSPLLSNGHFAFEAANQNEGNDDGNLASTKRAVR